ncbi:MAG TPA: hypothetical protein VMD27_06355 [Candidatus Aquilonibacter sp.]|nr:hypothetical protein [Candidatus Aquilonibacter sp.]
MADSEVKVVISGSETVSPAAATAKDAVKDLGGATADAAGETLRAPTGKIPAAARRRQQQHHQPMNGWSILYNGVNRSDGTTAFSAAQLAAALGKTPQAMRRALREVRPAAVRIVAGNEAAAWTVEQLPGQMREWLAIEAVRKNCKGDDYIRRIETLLSMPREKWQPREHLRDKKTGEVIIGAVIPISNVCDDAIQAATKLRDALKPFLVEQRDPKLSAEEWKQRGVDNYQRVFGNRITLRYWDELLTRTIRRDNGREEWNRLEIYLPDRLKRKDTPASVVSEALAADFAEIESFIAGCTNPHAPNKTECAGIWTLALEKFTALVNAGEPEKSAARRVRQFLFARASFLAASRDALLKAWDRKLAALKNANGDVKALRDGREDNGERVEIPAADIDILRHAAMAKHGGRIQSAWRSEYPRLSEYTRARYPDPFKCQAKIYELVNREIVDALHARHHGGKRAVRKIIGGLHGDRWAGIPAMHSWALDDVTSNIEVAFTNPDGSTSLILPQIIAVMDSASRKWVGWSISTDKAPTAGLVCEAALDGFRKNNIPKQLWVENGCVFGKSLLINGKEDDAGRTIVTGLAQYGCTVHHFGKMNPQAKAELERSFEAIQRLMERHPGFTGRHQMLDAPDEFKREQRLINSGKVEATKFRYTFEEFRDKVMPKLIGDYNSTPQFGHLNGLSPNEAFKALASPNDPPIEYDPKLEWMFANEKTIVTVETGGVKFPHRSSGRPIRVRGGRLVNLIGQELWAFVDRKDASMVTFMNLNFSDPFTMEICRTPSARQSSMAPGSDDLGIEIGKIREHERAVDDEYNRLLEQFGNPRRQLLEEIRNQSAPEISATITDGVRRVPVMNGRLAESAEQMQRQRDEIRAAKNQKNRRTAANRNTARHLDIPTVLVNDDEQSRRALELLGESPRSAAAEVESTEGNKP